MKHTRLMRKLTRGDRAFSALINKAFNEAIENGSASLVNEDVDLEIAKVGNDIVVEDKDTDEVTKFSENPEDPNDLLMEPINEEKVVENEVAPMSKRPFSRRPSSRRTYSENLDEVPEVVNQVNPVEDTVPEIVVNVTEGVNDNDKSGTIPFSVRIKGGVASARMYSVAKAIKKAFSEGEAPATEEAIENIINEKINEIKNEIKEEVKTESRRRTRQYCTESEVANIVEEKLNEAKEEIKTLVKTESRRNVKRWMRSFSEEEAQVANTPEEVAEEVVEEVTEIVNDPEIDPAVNLETKAESRGFSSKSGSQISKFLNCKIV